MTYPTYRSDLDDFGTAILKMAPTLRQAVAAVGFSCREKYSKSGETQLEEFWSAIAVIAANVTDAERIESRRLIRAAFEPVGAPGGHA